MVISPNGGGSVCGNFPQHADKHFRFRIEIVPQESIGNRLMISGLPVISPMPGFLKNSRLVTVQEIRLTTCDACNPCK